MVHEAATLGEVSVSVQDAVVARSTRPLGDGLGCFGDRLARRQWLAVAAILLWVGFSTAVFAQTESTQAEATPTGTSEGSSSTTGTATTSDATTSTTQGASAQPGPATLRVTALGQTRLDQVGLISIGGGYRANEWLSAEASIWGGAGSEVDADVLTLVVRARHPGGLGDVRVGRFILTMGAIRPLHLDGAAGRVRLPYRFTVEAFGGLPVVPHFGTYGRVDWAAGGRLSYALGDYGSVGLAYYQRRDGGLLADQEIGIDFGGAVLDWLDVAGRAALDITGQPGLSEVNFSVVAHDGPWRADLFGIQRSPSHILPATSLFSVLGDIPSTLAGANGRYRIAPRLDLKAMAAMRFFDGLRAYESLKLGSTLRLDALGKGAIGLEARREGTPEGGWIGLRGTARVPIVYGLGAVTELELVVPDVNDRGSVWPWGMLALRYDLENWRFSAAALALASPQYRFRFDALLRIETRWGGV